MKRRNIKLAADLIAIMDRIREPNFTLEQAIEGAIMEYLAQYVTHYSNLVDMARFAQKQYLADLKDEKNNAHLE